MNCIHFERINDVNMIKMLINEINVNITKRIAAPCTGQDGDTITNQ